MRERGGLCLIITYLWEFVFKQSSQVVEGVEIVVSNLR